MKLKKRKIKYSAIFLICWFALLVLLVDGVLKFQTLVDYFGSYAVVEVALLLLTRKMMRTADISVIISSLRFLHICTMKRRFSIFVGPLTIASWD